MKSFILILMVMILISCTNESWKTSNSPTPQIVLFEVCPDPHMQEETEARDLYQFFNQEGVPFQIVTNDHRWNQQQELTPKLMKETLTRNNPEIIHLAIHGTNKGLVIGHVDGEDIFLSIQEMEKMDIWKDRIIVSGACEGGKYADKLVAKGAKMIIASNEQIPWRDLGKFFSKFYEIYFKKKDPDSALKEAITLFPIYKSFQVFQ